MLVTPPDLFGPDFGVEDIDWKPDDPASINASVYTGKRSIAADPWHSSISAHVVLSPIVGDENIRAIRGFLRRCKGQVNIFRLFADLGVQNDNAHVTVAVDAHAGDSSLQLAGYDTPLLDGQFATVNGQLVMVDGDQGGSDTIHFLPMLRQDAPAGTLVQTARPYALVYMASSTNGYSLSGPAVYGITFDVEEAIREPDELGGGVFDTTVGTFDETTLSWDAA